MGMSIWDDAVFHHYSNHHYIVNNERAGSRDYLNIIILSNSQQFTSNLMPLLFLGLKNTLNCHLKRNRSVKNISVQQRFNAITTIQTNTKADESGMIIFHRWVAEVAGVASSRFLIHLAAYNL